MYWNESIEGLQDSAGVLSFSYPYVKSIPWQKLPNSRMSLTGVFDTLDIQSPVDKIASLTCF